MFVSDQFVNQSVARNASFVHAVTTFWTKYQSVPVSSSINLPTSITKECSLEIDNHRPKMTMQSSWMFFLTFLSLFVCTKSDAAARGSIMALIELCDARFAPPEVHLPHHSILAHGWAMP
jgi:hypothetical protein